MIGEGPFGALLAVLEHSRSLGFLGPGPVEAHVRRAFHTLPLMPGSAARILDLGSGGGIPGLPLALARPDTTWVLLDGSVTRAGFLAEAVADLGLAGRVEVVPERAEDAGRRTDLRASFDAVVARSFGAPAVTAECAAPFLTVGGTLVVAEPPGGAAGRWPAAGLQEVGLVAERVVAQPSAFQVLTQARLCPDRFPRRNGVPAKRPLF